MNRQEFEKLELQVQQSNLPLKSYLQQIGVSYSTYHYWRRKCSVDRNSIKQGKHSVNHVFLSPTSIINFTSKKQSYDDTRRSSRDNELLQRAQSDL